MMWYFIVIYFNWLPGFVIWGINRWRKGKVNGQFFIIAGSILELIAFSTHLRNSRGLIGTPDQLYVWIVPLFLSIIAFGLIITGVVRSFLRTSGVDMANPSFQKSEEKFRRLIETLKDSHFFYIHDTKGHFKYMSPSVNNIMGYSEKEYFAHYTKFFTDNPINNEAVRYTEMSIQGVKQPPYEIEIFHKNGSIRQLQVTETPVFDQDGKVIAVEGLAHDITEIKDMETQLKHTEKMEAIGTLAGGIAHDFNNILGVMIGYAEMAKDDTPEGSNIALDLDEVIETGNRAKDLVEQILDFSRQGELEIIPIQPAGIIKEAIKMLRPSIPRTIEIHQDIDPDCDLILAHPTQLHKILMNLCTNAFHALEQTGGEIFITLKNRDILTKDHKTSEARSIKEKSVELSIRDTGPGIDPAIQDKIFNPYFTTKEVGKGIGMGLSVIHGIVQSYGGSITVESIPGKGATFRILYPVAERERSKEKIVEQIQKGSERILFVDNEPFLAKMGQDMLNRLGYKVTVRQSSLEALETFQQKPNQFDLIITNQTMPGMTGEELGKEMIRIRPDIPIILCVGYSTIISEEKAKAIGIKEFALKPLLKSDIAKLIRKALDNS